MSTARPVEVTVRPARPADHPTVARLTVSAYRAGSPLSGPYEAELADVTSRAAAGELLVAVDSDDVPVGAVLLVWPPSRYAEIARPGEAEFRMLAVDPAAQGRGVGAALARACLARAAAGGADAVVICARDVAHPAHRLYRRLGFTRLPERDWSPLPGLQLWALRHGLAGWSGRAAGGGR